MGGLYSRMRITAWTMLSGLLAITGVPLFIGWYSKDSVLAQAQGFVWIFPQHFLLLVLPLATVGLTAFYMLRLWLLIFAGEPRDHSMAAHAHESSGWMTVPLLILAILSLVSAWGWPIWDSQSSLVASFLGKAQPLAVRYDFGHVLDQGELLHAGTEAPFAVNVRQVAHHYHPFIGYLAMVMVAIGMLFSWLIYSNGLFDSIEGRHPFPALEAFLKHRWYFDDLYQAIVVHPIFRLASWCRRVDQSIIDPFINRLAPWTLRLAQSNAGFDKRTVDGLVNGVARCIYNTGSELRWLQTGLLRSYLLFLVMATLGVFLILGYFMARTVAG